MHFRPSSKLDLELHTWKDHEYIKETDSNESEGEVVEAEFTCDFSGVKFWEFYNLLDYFAKLDITWMKKICEMPFLKALVIPCGTW